MARPVNANAEETKRRILTAASELFSDHGYEGTSVRQIASGAGVSLGMIRHYFGSKEGLYRSCIDGVFEIFGSLGPQIVQGVADGGDPVEVVSLALRQGFRFACENRNACRLMLWDMMQQSSWRTDKTDSEMLPFLLDTARALAPALKRDVADAAMATRSLLFLVARYATVEHDEIAFLLSDGDEHAKADASTVTAMEDHLVDVAIRLYT